MTTPAPISRILRLPQRWIRDALPYCKERIDVATSRCDDLHHEITKARPLATSSVSSFLLRVRFASFVFG